MSDSRIPFLVELHHEVQRTAIRHTGTAPARRRLGGRGIGPSRVGGVVGTFLAVVVAVGVAVAVLSVHRSTHAPRSTVISAGSLLSALGPEAPGFTGTAPASARAALTQAAQAAAAGAATPPLRNGQAWYSSARQLSNHQQFSGPTGERALPRIRASLSEQEKWFPANGEEREVSVSLAPPIYFPGGGSQGTPSAAPGFGDWDSMAPFTVTGKPEVVLRALAQGWTGYLGYSNGNQALPDLDSSAFTTLARAGSILGDEPISPTSRAAIFRALAELPRLGYVVNVRDPLGRRGVAVTETTSSIRAFAVPGEQRYQLELIFNPTTGVVLGQRTIAATAIPAMQVRRGTVLFSWAYRLTRLVAASSIPSPGPSAATREWLRSFANERRALEAPGHACHGIAVAGRRPPPNSRCSQALKALQQHTQAALARNPAVLRALRALITPPPAIR